MTEDERATVPVGGRRTPGGGPGLNDKLAPVDDCPDCGASGRRIRITGCSEWRPKNALNAECQNCGQRFKLALKPVAEDKG